MSGMGRKKGDTGANGKSVSKELSIYRNLKDRIGTDTKVYYIMILYCPEYLKDYDKEPIKTFEDLRNRYKCFPIQLQKIFVKGIFWNKVYNRRLNGY